MIARIKRWILRGFSYHSNIDTIDISPSTVAAIILIEKMIMLFMARNIFQNHAWFLFIICCWFKFLDVKRPHILTDGDLRCKLWLIFWLNKHPLGWNVLPAGLESATLKALANWAKGAFAGVDSPARFKRNQEIPIACLTAVLQGLGSFITHKTANSVNCDKSGSRGNSNPL